MIVCTYNRADLLPQCLSSLCEQTLDPSQYEVLVIDNCSTDRTQEIAEDFARRYPHLHYHVERKQGLGYARNRGLELAQGRYAAYIDDDARACPEYLETAARLFESLHPPPHCLGGPEQPWYTTARPAWFKDDYGSRRMWASAKYLSKYNSFSGSNQIWEIATLRKLGGFNVNLGVTGTMMGMGEETAVFYKAWDILENPQFYYSPSLIVYHWVPESKMSVTYQLKRHFTEAQCTASLTCPSFSTRCACFATRPYWLARAILRLILNVRTHPDRRNWLVEDWGRGVRLLGEMVGCFTTRPLFKQR
jgi:glucosyl-dolichyl phosphate glucuronosyltransferase